MAAGGGCGPGGHAAAAAGAALKNLQLDEELARAALGVDWRQIRAEKFVEPTPIQAQAWPVILAGHDLVGVAKTGSGKTLAFSIPMVIHMRAQPAVGAGDGPIALCMAPTRELATQIELEFQKILRGAGMRSVCCYGGQGRLHQEGILRAGAHAVVATAGPLLDFLKNQATNLRRVTYLVIDEADGMLDMGFEPQVRGILSQIRPDRQSLLFSATWPREVEALASHFLTDYVKINIGYEHLAVNTDVRQHIWFVEGHDRLKELLSLIMQVQEFVSKMLIFCKTKSGCDECVAYLRSQRIRVFVIHGDKTLEERESTLQAFRDAESSVLVSTAVAQRGLDIRSLQAVVNLDFPDNLEDYVHRIGRTGRAGEIGDAYTFFTPQHKHHAQGLVEILEEAKQPVDPILRWSGWKEGDWQQGQGDWKEEGGAPAASGSPKHTSPKAASPKAEAAAAIWTSQPQYGGALQQPQGAGLLARERPHVCDHERISCAFAEIDEGDKGFVTVDELERGFRALGINFTINTVQELFAKGDANQDQRLDRQEWWQFAMIYPNTVDAVYYRSRDRRAEQALRDSVAALQRDLELAQQNQAIARQLQEQEQQLRDASEWRNTLQQQQCESIEKEIKLERQKHGRAPGGDLRLLAAIAAVRAMLKCRTGHKEAEIPIDGDEIVQESSGKGRV